MSIELKWSRVYRILFLLFNKNFHWFTSTILEFKFWFINSSWLEICFCCCCFLLRVGAAGAAFTANRRSKCELHFFSGFSPLWFAKVQQAKTITASLTLITSKSHIGRLHSGQTVLTSSNSFRHAKHLGFVCSQGPKAKAWSSTTGSNALMGRVATIYLPNSSFLWTFENEIFFS